MENKFYRMPFEQWQANYNIEVEQKQVKGKKFSPNYVPYHDINILLRKHCPDLVFTVDEVLPFGDDDDCTYMIKCCLYDQASGLSSQSYMIPVMQHGASAHGAITNPDTRQISDSIKRAFVRVVAEETGLGYSMWSDFDLDPMEAEEPKAKGKSKRRKDDDDLPFDADIDDEFDDLLDDDLDDDDELEEPRRRRTTRRGRR